MARLLAVLLVVTGLVLVGAPAQAEVSLTITASSTTVLAGEPVTISGKAAGVYPGSLVTLQRRIDGVWTTVRSKRVWSARTYSFAFRPARGYQSFRVVKPRQQGQPYARSPVVRLTVRWAPTLAASAEFLSDPATGQSIRVTGTVTDGPAAPVVAFERQDAGGWVTLETRDVQPGVQFAFEAVHQPGPEYRVRLLSTALTTEQVSSTFVHTYTPYAMKLNDHIDLWNEQTTGSAAMIQVDIPASESVTVYAESGGVRFLGTVMSPSGHPTVTFGNYPDGNVVRFTAAETGTYTIDISQWESTGRLQLWLSTPKLVTATIDAPAITVDSDFPGQPVYVRFDTTGTPLFTIANGATTGETPSLLGPDNAIAQPWLTQVDHYREAVYRSAGGTYTLRMEPDYMVSNVSVQPLSVTQLEATVNGPNVEAVVDVPDRVVLIEFERPSERVTVGYPTTDLRDVGVFDATTGEPGPTGPGTSVVAVSAYDDRLLTLPVQLSTPLHLNATVDGPPVDVDLTGSYQREVAVHFHATAGQVIREAGTASGGLSGSTLTYAGGTVPNYLPITGGLWTIPADGDYTLTATAYGGVVGTVALETADSLTIPGDGTATTVDINEPGETIVATIAMPAGTVVDATLDNLSASLGDTWDVALVTPDNSYWYDSWAGPGTLPPFAVRPPGDIVALISAEQTGSLRLAFAPRS